MSASDVLESKVRLIIDDMDRTVATTTKDEVQARSAKKILRTGATIGRVFQIGLAGVKTAADKMLEAHLSTTGASDAEIAATVRGQLEPFLRTHLDKERSKGYAANSDRWSKCVAELWPEAETYFIQLEDRARGLRHDKNSKDTRLDRLLRKPKDHPALAWVLFIVIGAIGAIGAVEVVGNGVQQVRARMKPVAPAVAATQPAPPPFVTAAPHPPKFGVGD